MMIKLQTLYLRNFRNYKEATLTFSPHLNYIYGKNAQGKTNLLEAICLLMTGRSFRTRHLTDLIRFGAATFYLEAHFEKNGVEQVLKMSFDGQKRTIIHNANTLVSVSSLLGILNGVIIAPEDYELVKGSPIARRHFLDLQIACENPLYLQHLSRYIKAMKHRNILLRRKKLDAINIWEEQMAESASYLTFKRKQIVDELKDEINSQALTLTYQTSAPIKLKPKQVKEYFVLQYEKNRAREIEQGNTLIGPHRDDIIFLIQGKEARFFASEGQVRSSIALLRLGQWTRLKETVRQTPLLCVDDVGICLDPSREAELHHKLCALGQVFMTSARLKENLPKNTHLIQILNGNILF